MTAASSEASPGFLKSLIQLVFYGGILVAFGSFAYTQFYGNPFRSMMGDNLLEAATQPGVSDKSRMDAFKNAGGLDKESTWKGFQVRKYEAVYHPDAKLAMINFTLVKSWPGKQLASLDNLRAAMTPQCGSSWRSSNVGNASVLQTKDSPAGFTCSALDQGQEDIVVSIANMVTADASAKAPAPQAPATLSPNIETAPSANSTQAQTSGASVPTVGGVLRTAPSADGYQITLNNKPIPGTEGEILEMTQTFRVAGNDVVLVMKGNSGSCCNTYSTLYFVTITPSGKATASVGKDSVEIESGEDGAAVVKVSGEQLAVTTETADGRRKKTHRYIFANGKVAVSK